jgi:hypothetical protein
MRSRMILGGLLFLFLTAMFYILLPDFIYRREFDQAFWSWYKSPTPENAILLRDQQRKNIFFIWDCRLSGFF